MYYRALSDVKKEVCLFDAIPSEIPLICGKPFKKEIYIRHGTMVSLSGVCGTLTNDSFESEEGEHGSEQAKWYTKCCLFTAN